MRLIQAECILRPDPNQLLSGNKLVEVTKNHYGSGPSKIFGRKPNVITHVVPQLCRELQIQVRPYCTVFKWRQLVIFSKF
uniref:Uncharacterized protein n=1 Tax=Lepeophtheirus salmonis TaxID=72036 RepID=A0A0K2TNR6_LEPSM